MVKLKRIGIGLLALLIITMIGMNVLQYNKIEKLKTKLLIEQVNEGQNNIIIEVIPKQIDAVAPDPKGKAIFSNKIYGGK